MAEEVFCQTRSGTGDCSHQKVPFKHADEFRDCHHEFAAQIDAALVGGQIDRLPHHALITAGERNGFVRVAEFAQNTPHFVRAAMRLLNGFQRRVLRHFARLRALQQPALKRAAAHRSLAVNPAQLRVETRTRLRKTEEGGAAPPRHTERGEPLSIVAGLQTNVGKQDAVATQRTARAERRDRRGWFR